MNDAIWLAKANSLKGLIETRQRILADIGVTGLIRFIDKAVKNKEVAGHYNYKKSYYESFREHMLDKPREHTSFEDLLIWDLLEELYE